MEERFPAPVFETGLAPVRKYFTDLFGILTRPHAFFRRMPLTGGASGPLAFALVTHWLGSACDYLWHLALGARVGPFFERAFRMAGDVADVDSPGRGAMIQEFRDRVVHWLWGAGSVIADPFLTLVGLMITSVFVYAGARILVSPGKRGAPDEITFESALRIVCFGMSPAILAAFPLLGPVVGNIFSAIVTIIGAKEVYRLGYGRATAVALFPKLLLLGIMILGFFFVALLVVKILTTTF